MSSEQMPMVSSILQHSPNGILLVDEQARIEYINPAFRSMLCTGDEDLTGRKAAEFLQSDCFERVIAEDQPLSIRGSVPPHDLHYRATLFKLEGEHRYCGIFVDTSEEEQARTELSKMKRETLARAQEVIRGQMRTAQEIAGLLGETTAETKVLLAKLMDLFRQDETP